MVTQLEIGGALTVASFLIAAFAWWMLESVLRRLHRWAEWPPHGPKLMVILTFSLTVTLAMMTTAVWLWAVAFYLLDNFEAAVYFALVAFTTLGFGDLLLPTEWRLLGGLAAANGLLLFGLLTAILVETLRETRSRQRKPRD